MPEVMSPVIRPGKEHRRRCCSHEAGVDVERGGGVLRGRVVEPVHDRELHLLRRLPVPLPLVDEPVVDLLLLQPRRLGQRNLLHLLRACNATTMAQAPPSRSLHQQTNKISGPSYIYNRELLTEGYGHR